jgi:hypothetical protein
MLNSEMIDECRSELIVGLSGPVLSSLRIFSKGREREMGKIGRIPEMDGQFSVVSFQFGGLRFVVSHPFRKEREMDGARRFWVVFNSDVLAAAS